MVAVLAVGIALNVGVFTVLEGVLLEPLPYPDADALVRLWERHPERGLDHHPVAPAKVDDWRALAGPLFRDLVPYRVLELDLTGGPEPEAVPVAMVGEGFLAALGVSPVLGRGFDPDEVRAGARLALVDHAFWAGRYGSHPEALGRTVVLAGTPHRIVGVLPPGAIYPEEARILVPLEIENRSSRAAHGLSVLARLAPEIGRPDARRRMAEVAVRLAREHPETDAGWRIRLEGLREARVGDVSTSLILLQGAVGLVLVLVFANAATLLLGRALEREGEIQIRRALGAPGLRVAGGLVAESLLLAGTGGVLGAALAPFATDAVLVLAPSDLPYLERIAVDAGAVALIVGLAVLLGTATGLLQAGRAGRRDVARVLTERAGRGAGAIVRRPTHVALVAGQTALATLLLITAGLLWRSVRAVEAVETGIRSAGVATARVAPPLHRYPRGSARTELYRSLLERSRDAFGAAGLVSHLPLSGEGAVFRFWIEGRPAASFADLETTEIRAATAGYFRVMEIPLIRGRSFDDRDGRDASGVVLVNRAFARRHWPDEDPVGRRVSVEGTDGPWLTVVGVVGNVRHAGPTEPPVPEMYRPFRQEPWPAATLVVRSADPTAALGRLRSVVHAVDPDLPLRELRTLDTLRARATTRWRFPARLFGAFGAVALLLAAMGTFAVLSFDVRQRRRELGVRAALGAGPREIVRLVVRGGLAPVAVGIVAGAGVAALCEDLLRSLLFGVDAHDPLTFAAAPAVLLAAALAASWLPALRAARVDPAAILREV